MKTQNNPWSRWQQRQYLPEELALLQQHLGLHPALCGMLLRQGLRTPEAAVAYLEARWEQVHDPHLLHQMPQALARLLRAIDQAEPVLLYGDYDVDGTTAVALLYQFLQPLCPKLDYYVPDRHEEGYGLSEKGVRHAAEKGYRLVLVLDCGTRDLQSAALAKSLGIDLIICDHHEPGEVLPEVLALINPLQAECRYPYKHLSGAGLAFKLVQALQQALQLPKETLLPALEFLAISIACDIVPMTGENRVLAYWGLRRLNRTQQPGLQALLQASSRVRPLRISDLVFGVGPLLNAAGRVAQAREAIKLLLSHDARAARDQARLLQSYNEERRRLNALVEEAAVRQAESQLEQHSPAALVLYQPNWHAGVLGIVASRVAEKFQRPVVLLSLQGELLSGSVRSSRGLNALQGLQQCAEYLHRYGGHQQAAGVKLLPENLEAFREAFAQAPAFRNPEQTPTFYDAELPLQDIQMPLWKQLQRLEPFGPENPSPLFCARGLRCTRPPELLKGQHLRLRLAQGNSPEFEAIGFYQAYRLQHWPENPRINLLFKLDYDSWQNRDRIRLEIRDMQVSS